MGASVCTFISIIFNILLLFAIIFLSVHGRYIDKAKVKFGIKKWRPDLSYICAVNGWRNCLEQMDVNADIVFFGDSITRNFDFRRYFPGYIILNLGIGGDNILSMSERTNMISSVHPIKIFIMGG